MGRYKLTTFTLLPQYQFLCRGSLQDIHFFIWQQESGSCTECMFYDSVYVFT